MDTRGLFLNSRDRMGVLKPNGQILGGFRLLHGRFTGIEVLSRGISPLEGRGEVIAAWTGFQGFLFGQFESVAFTLCDYLCYLSLQIALFEDVIGPLFLEVLGEGLRRLDLVSCWARSHVVFGLIHWCPFGCLAAKGRLVSDFSLF